MKKLRSYRQPSLAEVFLDQEIYRKGMTITDKDPNSGGIIGRTIRHLKEKRAEKEYKDSVLDHIEDHYRGY